MMEKVNRSLDSNIRGKTWISRYLCDSGLRGNILTIPAWLQFAVSAKWFIARSKAGEIADEKFPEKIRDFYTGPLFSIAKFIFQYAQNEA